MLNKFNAKMETQAMIPDRKRKSVKLTKREHAALIRYRKRYNTSVECAISIGVDRMVLDRVLLVGSGAPESITKIRAILPKE